MGFSPSVKEDVLVACGRHCALCHKFCGLKIELHHIKQHADGGPDTFDNCIPLCFECHGDMRSYDHKHPKGTKYTEGELKRHRDLWYTKVSKTQSVILLPQHVELDRDVFRRICELLPWNTAIMFVRRHTFANPFLRDKLNPLYAFWEECDNPAFEFIDADLEGARANLLDAVTTFLNHISYKTFPTQSIERSSIDYSVEDRNHMQFVATIHLLDECGTAVANRYDELVKISRRKLGSNNDIVAAG